MERPRFDAQREREFITRGWWRDDTLPKWLARHAVERPDSPAVVFAGGGLTWQTLRERALKVAQCLKTRGVGHGDVVAVQLPNIPEFIVAYFATNDCFWPVSDSREGAKALPLGYRASRDHDVGCPPRRL